MKAARHFVAQCLHIIVLALTNLGWMTLVVAWMSLGCGPGVIEVQPTDATAFQQMLQADTMSDARRRAHLMPQYVRGDAPGKNPGFLDDAKLPEAYTPNGQPGIWASQYHLGYAATRLLREYYAAAHPAHRVLESDELVEIVDAASGNTHMVHDFDRDRHVDIADIEGRFVFEVVPWGQTHQEAGKTSPN